MEQKGQLKRVENGQQGARRAPARLGLSDESFAMNIASMLTREKGAALILADLREGKLTAQDLSDALRHESFPGYLWSTEGKDRFNLMSNLSDLLLCLQLEPDSLISGAEEVLRAIRNHVLRRKGGNNKIKKEMEL